MTEEHILVWLAILAVVWLVSGPFWMILLLVTESLRNPGEATLHHKRFIRTLAEHMAKDRVFSFCMLPTVGLLTVLSWVGLWDWGEP